MEGKVNAKKYLMSKLILTQSDFDAQMMEWQEELRNIMVPLCEQENELRVEIGKLNVKVSELCLSLYAQKEHWANICEQQGIREEKLTCLAEGRQIKAKLTLMHNEINKKVLELRILRQKRKSLSQPYHDLMHELIKQHPKGTLPLISR